MSPIIYLLLAGLILVIGFAAGATFEERNLERRERKLAQARRRPTVDWDEPPHRAEVGK